MMPPDTVQENLLILAPNSPGEPTEEEESANEGLFPCLGKPSQAQVCGTFFSQKSLEIEV